jgi:hypothetical protein
VVKQKVKAIEWCERGFYSLHCGQEAEKEDESSD